MNNGFTINPGDSESRMTPVLSFCYEAKPEFFQNRNIYLHVVT